MAWLSGYTYRKAINITGSTGAPVPYKGYKVVIQPGVGTDSPPTVYLNNKSKFFPNDLAFTAADGETKLKYWYEYDSNNFWLEVTADLGSNQIIYLYYGNSSVLPNPVDAPLTAVWKKYASNPVLTVGTGGQWDDFWVQFNSIVYNPDDSKYYGYYEGSQNTALFRIGLATSTDGITWTKNGGNPILTVGTGGAWDDSLVGYPCVWREDSTHWYMLYSGKQTASGKSQIGLATSSDGISWSKSESNPVITNGATLDTHIMQPGTRVLKEDGTYYCYYWGNTVYALSGNAKILLATSTDLTTWTKSGNNPMLSGGASQADWDYAVLAPTVIKLGSTYYMWFEGYTYDSGNFNRSQNGLASSTSKDSGWSKYATNPVIDNSQGLTGSSASAGDLWDTTWTECAVMIQFGNEWRMYYGGSKGSPNTPRCQVGYATYTQIGDPVNTFLLFSDFNGRTLDSAKWNNLGTFTQDQDGIGKYAANTNTIYLLKSQNTYTAPLAIKAKCKVGVDWVDEYSWLLGLLFDSAWATTGYLGGHYKDASNDYSRVYKFGTGATNNGTNESFGSANVYYKYELLIGSTTQVFLIDGTQKGSISVTIQTNPNNIQLATGRSSATSDFTTYFDWVFVRSYMDTEPSISSFGSEEEVPPQNPYQPWMQVSPILAQ